MDTFAQRFSKALSIRNITAAELSRRLGVNEGTLSNYKKGTTSHAKLEIVQTFDKIQIYFIADNSKSCAINAKIENTNIHPELCYSYKNEGNGVDKNNKTHIGTAVLTFIEDKIDGFYYNNGKDRSTYGTIKSLE